MKIESIIQRERGTVVSLGEHEYHFKPEKKGGPHTADVTNADHIDRLLSIREGFRKASDKGTPDVAPPVEPVAPVEPPAPTVAPPDTSASVSGAKHSDDGDKPEEKPAPKVAIRRPGRPKKAP